MNVEVQKVLTSFLDMVERPVKRVVSFCDTHVRSRAGNKSTPLSCNHTTTKLIPHNNHHVKSIVNFSGVNVKHPFDTGLRVGDARPEY